MGEEQRTVFVPEFNRAVAGHTPTTSAFEADSEGSSRGAPLRVAFAGVAAQP